MDGECEEGANAEGLAGEREAKETELDCAACADCEDESFVRRRESIESILSTAALPFLLGLDDAGPSFTALVLGELPPNPGAGGLGLLAHLEVDVSRPSNAAAAS